MKTIRLGILTIVLLFSSLKMCGASFRWDVAGTAGTRYDDNITFVKKNRISDVVTQLSLGAGFKQESKTYAVNFQGALTENIFAQHSSHSNFDQNISLDGRKDVTEYDHLSARETFAHSEEPYTLQDAFGRTTGRYGTYRNRLDLQYAHDITKQWSAKLKYLQSNDIFSRSDLNDSVQYIPGIETFYALDSMTQVMAGYDYAHSFFDAGTDAGDHTLSAGLRRYLTNKWYVDFKSGVDFINAFNGRDFTKPRFDVGLTHEPDENTAFNLKYVKQYSIGPFTQDVFNNWRWVLSAFKQITARWKGNLSGFYGKGKYIFSDISDQLGGVNLNVQYALSERMSVSSSYRYERNNSNVGSREYSRNMILLGFTFAF